MGVSIHSAKSTWICDDCNHKKKPGASKRYRCICVVCGNEFYSYRKTSTHCSHKCSNQDENTKEKLRQNQLQKVKNGTHVGWISRNIHSYPEIFWMGILNKNNIDFEQEVFIKDLHYFLDFVIPTKTGLIDLEIDGSQHKQPIHKEHDMIRDSKLKEIGYVVYRIPWNSINSEEGKLKMKEKIDNFLKFYNKMNL